MTDPKPYKIHVGFGDALREDGDETALYEFATEGERAAFLMGVEAMDGWSAYETFDAPHVFREGSRRTDWQAGWVEVGRDGPFSCAECEEVEVEVEDTICPACAEAEREDEDDPQAEEETP